MFRRATFLRETRPYPSLLRYCLSKVVSTSASEHRAGVRATVPAVQVRGECMHTYIHTCMHACIHTYIHTYIRARAHTHIHTQRRSVMVVNGGNYTLIQSFLQHRVQRVCVTEGRWSVWRPAGLGDGVRMPTRAHSVPPPPSSSSPPLRPPPVVCCAFSTGSNVW